MIKIIRTWLGQAPYPLAASVLFAQIALGIVLFAIFQEFVPLELEARDSWTGYLLAIYGGSRFIFEPFAGALSDRIERKLGMVLGFSLMLIGLVLMGIFWDAHAYLIFAAVFGLATAFLWPAVYAISADFYEASDRGKAVGFLNVAQLVGFGIGALIGAFVVNQLPTLLFILAIAAIALALLIAIFRIPAYRGGGIIPKEEREKRPPLKTTLSKKLIFWSSLVLLIMVGVSIMIPAIRAYGTNQLEVSFTTLTLLLFPSIAAGAALYIPSGHFADSVGRTLPLIIGQLFVIAGGFIVAATRDPIMASAFTAFIFCGYVLSVPSLSAGMMDLAPASHRGTLIGLMVALSGLGLAIGPAIGGAIIDSFDAPQAFQAGSIAAAISLTAIVIYGLIYGYERPSSRHSETNHK